MPMPYLQLLARNGRDGLGAAGHPARPGGVLVLARVARLLSVAARDKVLVVFIFVELVLFAPRMRRESEHGGGMSEEQG